jgi:hypothetical protein
MRRSLGFLTIVVVALILSGCADPKAGLLASDVPRASHDAESGGIEGIVVDPEFRPIGGARMQLIGVPSVVNSTGDGRFAFSGLVAQDYLMVVTASGFFESKQGVSVPVGNVTEVRVILRPIPPAVPYADASYVFNGVIRHGYAYRVASQESNFSGFAPSTYPEAIRSIHQSSIVPRGDFQTLLLEVDWTPSSDQSDQLALQLRYYGKGVSLTPFVTGGDPALRWRMDRPSYDALRRDFPGIDFSTPIGLQLTVTPATDGGQPVDVGVYVEQRFTVYGTIGYNGFLAPDYTRVAPR